jgi:hypothetical protein
MDKFRAEDGEEVLRSPRLFQEGLLDRPRKPAYFHSPRRGVKGPQGEFDNSFKDMDHKEGYRHTVELVGRLDPWRTGSDLQGGAVEKCLLRIGDGSRPS